MATKRAALEALVGPLAVESRAVTTNAVRHSLRHHDLPERTLRAGHEACFVERMNNDKPKLSPDPTPNGERLGQLSTEPTKLEPTPERAHEKKLEQERQAGK